MITGTGARVPPWWHSTWPQHTEQAGHAVHCLREEGGRSGHEPNWDLGGILVWTPEIIFVCNDSKEIKDFKKSSWHAIDKLFLKFLDVVALCMICGCHATCNGFFSASSAKPHIIQHWKKWPNIPELKVLDFNFASPWGVNKRTCVHKWANLSFLYIIFFFSSINIGTRKE